MHATLPLLAATDFPPIRRHSLETLQVNLGYKCNQSCLHCHVAASPQRTEMMDGETIALVLDVLRQASLWPLAPSRSCCRPPTSRRSGRVASPPALRASMQQATRRRVPKAGSYSTLSHRVR
jgi:hypothetical protein